MNNTNSNIEIYGFSGKIGTGKDFIARNMFYPLLEKKKTIFLAFANALKIEAMTKGGFSFNEMFVNKTDESRQFLQKEGTRVKEEVDYDYWLKIVEGYIEYYKMIGYERFIITDVRFQNEFNFIHDLGGVNILVEAPQRSHDKIKKEALTRNKSYEEIADHISENDLNDENRWYYRIKNDYGDKPANSLKILVQQLKENNKPNKVIFIDIDDTLCDTRLVYEKIIFEAFFKTYEFFEKQNIKNLKSNFTYKLWDKVFNSYNIYRTVHFEKSNFADALINTFKHFEKLLKNKSNVDDFIKNLVDLAYSVFDAEYKPLYSDLSTILFNFNKKGKVVLVSQGDYQEQVRKILDLGLYNYSLEIINDKRKSDYYNLMQKYSAHEYVMIGDNFYKDILPASEAGVNKTFWINSKHKDNEESCENCFEVESLYDINL